jgi:hypothetical protein
VAAVSCRRPAPPPSEASDAQSPGGESVALLQWAGREAALRRRKARLGGRPFARENLFRLARELRALGRTPAAVADSPAWAEACRLLAARPDDLFAALTDAVGRVRVAPDADRLSAAMRAADRDAHRFPVPAEGRPYYARLLAVAHHLSRTADTGGWFAFGSARLAAWLDLHRNTVDVTVGHLERLGLLRVARDADGRTRCSYSRGDSRMVRYTGPPPAAAPADADPPL